MLTSLRNSIAQLIRPLPLRALDWLMPRSLIGFCYHAVCEAQPPHLRHLSTFKTPAEFERDLDYLVREFTPVSYADLCTGRYLQRGNRPAAVITFDDGLRECYSVARPLLLKRGVPAMFFVTTRFLDNGQLFYRHKVSLCIEEYSRRSGSDQKLARYELAKIANVPLFRNSDLMVLLHSMNANAEAKIDAFCNYLRIDPPAYLLAAAPYLSSAEVRALAADGFTIGAHSQSHLHVASMTPADAETDITASCAKMAELVGAATVPYAFPFSGRGVSRELLRRVRSTHSHVGLFFDTQGIATDSPDVVNRISVDVPRARHVVALPLAIRRAYVSELKPLARKLRLRVARDYKS